MTKYEIKKLGELVTIKLEDEEGTESMMLTIEQLNEIADLIHDFQVSGVDKLVRE